MLKLNIKNEMRASNSINQRITRSQIHNNRLKKNEEVESVPPTPTMASQPPDPSPTALITSTISVVQLVGLPPATPMVHFPSFDGNLN